MPNAKIVSGVGADMLPGADRIAEFLFGDPGRRKEIYRAAGKGTPPERRLPTFKFGGLLTARKSTLLAWLDAQERAAVAPKPAPEPPQLLPAEPVPNPKLGAPKGPRKSRGGEEARL